MKIDEAYPSFYESRIRGRYVTSEHISPLLDGYSETLKISDVGTSVKGEKIKLVTVGNGPKKVLAWSQMHGNESTTTKAFFDFLRFVTQKEQFQTDIEALLRSYTISFIPILNPDGARLYTRENANGVDLNRDAQQLSEPESRTLSSVFKAIKPHLCLNLHDQRSIYGFASGAPATVSFLAPSADPDRSITEARKIAMQHIEKMNHDLQQLIPGKVGRYDDAFNLNCVGDTFQRAKVPTILFEAGHFPDDYQREETRKFIFVALLSLFNCTDAKPKIRKAYASMPENKKNFYDIIIRNVRTHTSKSLLSVALQYREILDNERIVFVPYVEEIGALTDYFGHRELSAEGAKILVNSQEKYRLGEKVLNIVNKKDKSLLYIN